MESICGAPSVGLLGGALRMVDADSDAGDLLSRIVALLDLRGGRDKRRLLVFADSSSRPGVAGVAYRPVLAGGASLLPCGDERSSSQPVVAGAAYRPSLAGGASRSPLGAGALEVRAGEVGTRLFWLDLDDMVRSRETVR
jgi:hypothetical protein